MHRMSVTVKGCQFNHNHVQPIIINIVLTVDGDGILIGISLFYLVKVNSKNEKLFVDILPPKKMTGVAKLVLHIAM